MLLLSGCSSAQEAPTTVYKGPFEASKVDAADAAVGDVAKKWNLRVFRKDRKHMRRLTDDKEAFFVALYFDKDPVVVVTNVGVATVLSVTISNYGRMPVQDLNRLTTDVIDTLKQLGVELREDMSAKSK